MTDQELADLVHNATRALNRAWADAQAAGLIVDVGSFVSGPQLRASVRRTIPASVTSYAPSEPYAE